MQAARCSSSHAVAVANVLALLQRNIAGAGVPPDLHPQVGGGLTHAPHLAVSIGGGLDRRQVHGGNWKVAHMHQT